MAKFKVGGNSEFRVSAAAGATATANHSAFVDTLDPIGIEFMQLDVTAFTDTGERVMPGIQVAQEIAVSGAFEGTTTTGPDVVYTTMVGTIGTFQYYPAGSSGGERFYTGACMFVSYKPSGEAKGRVNYEARLKVDGTITSATV